MSMKDTAESCSSRAGVDSSRTHPRLQQQQRHKLEAYAEVLRRLRKAGRPEVLTPSFEDGLLNHFNRLPERYALDVNVERAEDVLTHKKLLELAQEPANRPVFAVRLVQVPPFPEGKQVDSSDSDAPRTGHAQSDSTYFRQGVHPPLPFGSSPNLEALAFECSRQQVQDGASVAKAVQHLRPMHEITFSTHDKPKLLSLLTFLLAELGLNIHEAHAFSTSDGYSLDVFVVDGWPYEYLSLLLFNCVETKQLRDSLQKEIHKMGVSFFLYYHGTYNSQDIAIKVLKPESVNVDMQQEFAQEVFIMRNIHHSNVVQFIGACTRPNFCIVTEFMSGGSVYDFLHRQKGVFEIPALLQVAIDVSRGMNYLHQNNIVHRDLKTANLLMDENEASNFSTFIH
ncbi:hypothetical protein C4D60_Mb01t18060 [Musa balbisiana]|uniref:Protein kinase domain-containing protein n=1 Tax=Musa balbisiana TaxID=52838 RepID=A0A4S8JN99_MUSBA|nr:hypothetical protein C4D60_Mb01t18060 [Musa balbisiana]